MKGIFEKFHIRSGAQILGGFLILLGTIMVFSGISGGGEIDVSSALINGKMKSGSVGLLFSFLGALIVMVSVIVKPQLHKLKVSNGDISIEWEGVINSTTVLMTRMGELVGEIEKTKHQ